MKKINSINDLKMSRVRQTWILEIFVRPLVGGASGAILYEDSHFAVSDVPVSMLR